jgi:hypothetical protein
MYIVKHANPLILHAMARPARDPRAVSLKRQGRVKSVMTSVEPTSDLATMRQRTSCMHLSV